VLKTSDPRGKPNLGDDLQPPPIVRHGAPSIVPKLLERPALRDLYRFGSLDHRVSRFRGLPRRAAAPLLSAALTARSLAR
jgi:hypothetical protein